MQRGEIRDIEIELLLEAIFQRFHHDFRDYAKASLKRRVEVAMQELDCPSVSVLQDRMLHEPKVFDRLLQLLTIQVSDLFRNPAFFRVFREQVAPELKTYPSLKVWVAGCSSGEELYSVAITLREEGLLGRTILYATDINPRALAHAESGIYSLERVPAFTENYREAGGKESLAEYYTAAYDGVRFDPSLRANVVFSDHSLATDNVFAEVQVVFCRNVLIYFNRKLQHRAMGLFTGSLCRRGFLGLGSRETLRFDDAGENFTQVHPGCQWYRRA